MFTITQQDQEFRIGTMALDEILNKAFPRHHPQIRRSGGYTAEELAGMTLEEVLAERTELIRLKFSQNLPASQLCVGVIVSSAAVDEALKKTPPGRKFSTTGRVSYAVGLYANHEDFFVNQVRGPNPGRGGITLPDHTYYDFTLQARWVPA